MGNGGGQIPQMTGSMANLEKHFVREELVILENINDSSGNPGDFQFLPSLANKTSDKKPKILHI